MFLSKIWFFAVAVIAACAITVAVTLPRPADRAAQTAEHRRIKTACVTANILLEQNARQRIDLAASFAQAAAPAGSPRLKLDGILGAASRADEISAEANRTGKTAVSALLDSIKGRQPDFAIALDNSGRVVARVGEGVETNQYGDSMAGYFAIDDALHGYLRDDTWKIGDQLYRIAAAPVVSLRDESYAGAVVLGNAFDKELAEDFQPRIGADVAFYVAGQPVSSSSSVQLHKDAAEAYRQMTEAEPDPDGPDEQNEAQDCATGEIAQVTVAGKDYGLAVARLPGEAGQQGAFMAVFSEKPPVLGFWGSIEQLTSSDVTVGDLVPIGLLLLLIVAAGIALMYWESDRPLKRLAAEAVALGKGERERFDETRHRGQPGSVARSVNIALDKMAREAKSAKRDLDSLLGPAPGDSAGPPLPSMPAPASAPAPAAPPPSEFKFGDRSGPVATPRPSRQDSSQPIPAFDLDLPPPPPALSDEPLGGARAPSQSPIPPPPISLPGGPPVGTPMPAPASASASGPARSTVPIAAFEDDILGEDDDSGALDPSDGDGDFDEPTRVADPAMRDLQRSAASPSAGGNGEFQRTFDEFVALKQQCGERTESLTYEKFATKLRKNRAALMEKHSCKSVRFQVYVKDGKAALKATPIK